MGNLVGYLTAKDIVLFKHTAYLVFLVEKDKYSSTK
jgi:hypothetical protein